MIPRLFDGTATTFTSGGITTLTDAISCTVIEKRNGEYELEMVVATTNPYFEQIQVGRLIVAKPNHDQGVQAFEIYEISKPINQQVTVLAHHISYRMSFIPVKPFVATGINDTLTGLNSTYVAETNPFTITTNITNTGSTYNQAVPASLRSRLGGTEGSLLDVFGGEYKWDNFTASLLSARGSNNGVELRVGKNIVTLDQNINWENVLTGVLPYWVSEDGLTVYYGDVQYSVNVGDYPYKRTGLLDTSELFDTAPTNAQLNQAGADYLATTSILTPDTNITVSFVDLSDTTEYQYPAIEQINLCDTVAVYYAPLGISFTAKVVSLTYDVLAERTLSVEIGTPKSTMSQTINAVVSNSASYQKLVSIVQDVDYDLGAITTRVSTVEGDLETANEDISELSQTANGISASVATIQQDYVGATAVEITASEGVNVYTNATLNDQGEIQYSTAHLNLQSDGMRIHNANDVIVAEATTSLFRVTGGAFQTGGWQMAQADESGGKTLDFYWVGE